MTPDPLRFDFTHPRPMAKEEIRCVEELVNWEIHLNLAVTVAMMTIDEAQAAGAMILFCEMCGWQLKVFSIGNFSIGSLRRTLRRAHRRSGPVQDPEGAVLVRESDASEPCWRSSEHTP